MTNESNDRLSTEMTAVFTLNAERSRVISFQAMQKGQAAEKTMAVVGGDLLDLDEIYGGLLVRGIYIFVSELALARGIEEYGANALNGLISERAA